MSPPAHTLGIRAITENLLKRNWSIPLLRHLNNGVVNPVDIAKREPDLTATAMNERFRTMLRYHLISRYPKAGARKEVEYHLTPKGRRLLGLLEMISQLNDYPDHDPRSLEEIFHLDPSSGKKLPLVQTEPRRPAPASPPPRSPKSRIILL